MPQKNGRMNSWMSNWMYVFDKNHPMPRYTPPQPPPDPCAPCHCNTVSVANCTCEIENQLQQAFAQHSWYTVLTLNAVLANTAVSANTSYMAASLGNTANVISSSIAPYTTNTAAVAAVNAAVTHHIQLADAYVGTLKSGGDVTDTQKAFKAQATELATAFSALNPCMLTYNMMFEMWEIHIQYVITIAELLNTGSKEAPENNQNYVKANVESTDYSLETANMAIMIADGLADIYCCQGC